MGNLDDKASQPNRSELLARLRDPQPGDGTLPADADGYLRRNAEVREARERLPELDQSE